VNLTRVLDVGDLDVMAHTIVLSQLSGIRTCFLLRHFVGDVRTVLFPLFDWLRSSSVRLTGDKG